MKFLTYDCGNLYCIFLENELVLGFDRPILSIKLDCRDFEYKENGIVLYGSEPNGLLRSHNALSISERSTYLAMHDGNAEIKPLNGSRIIPNENGDSYSFTCVNGERSLTVSFKGNCRCDGNILHFRRGETIITLYEPTETTVTPKRHGFEYEAEKCLSLITENGALTPDSELLPLLLLVNGLKTAACDQGRVETVKSLLPTMSDNGRKTAAAILCRHARAFGKEISCNGEIL